MKLIHCIRNRIGSNYKDEFNDEALAEYAKLKGFDSALLVNEAKNANYDYNKCEHLRKAIKTNEDWRKINWCYALVVWRKNQKEAGGLMRCGMGVMFREEKTDLVQFFYIASKFHLSVNRFDCRVKRNDGDTIRMIRDRKQTDMGAWNEDVSAVLQHIFEDSNNPRFDPEEMCEVDGKYLSYYYDLTFRDIIMVFHTTEKGFDMFSTIRNEIMKNLTPATIDLLGEYISILR